MQVRLRVPDIDVAMESREFEILQDAITHVCLAPVRPQSCCKLTFRDCAHAKACFIAV